MWKESLIRKRLYFSGVGESEKRGKQEQEKTEETEKKARNNYSLFSLLSPVGLCPLFGSLDLFRQNLDCEAALHFILFHVRPVVEVGQLHAHLVAGFDCLHVDGIVVQFA